MTEHNNYFYQLIENVSTENYVVSKIEIEKIMPVGIEMQKDGFPYGFLLLFIQETDNGTIMFQAIDATGGDDSKGKDFIRTTEFKEQVFK